MRSRLLSFKATAVFAAALLAPALGFAAPACQVPAWVTPAPVASVPPHEVQRARTAYHVLALTWSPEWCRGHGDEPDQRLQCQGAPRGFVLHGLWPNSAAAPYPRYCETVGALDAALVKEMVCRTPSTELLQHEWQAHGACGWTDPAAYFGQAARLYDRIVMPRLEAIAQNQLTAGSVRQAFTRANPWLRPNMQFVVVDKAGRLTEMRLCYDLKFQPAACPAGTGAPDRIALRLTASSPKRSF